MSHCPSLIGYRGDCVEGLVLYVCLLSGRHVIEDSSCITSCQRQLTLCTKCVAFFHQRQPLRYIQYIYIAWKTHHISCCFPYSMYKLDSAARERDILCASLLTGPIWHPFHSWRGHANEAEEMDHWEMQTSVLELCFIYFRLTVYKTFLAEHIFRDV